MSVCLYTALCHQYYLHIDHHQGAQEMHNLEVTQLAQELIWNAIPCLFMPEEVTRLLFVEPPTAHIASDLGFL